MLFPPMARFSVWRGWWMSPRNLGKVLDLEERRRKWTNVDYELCGIS